MTDKNMTKLTEQNRPKFEDPPVIEVVATAQFSPIDEKLFLLSVDKIWESVGKEAFPVMDYKNRRASLSNDNSPMRFEFVDSEDAFHFPRLWFESADRSFVIQMQSDRLSFSWRKLDNKRPSDYSSYEVVWTHFLSSLNAICGFAKNDCKSPLEVNFLELAYINVIPFSDFGGAENIHKCIPSITSENIPPYLGKSEAVNFLWDIPIDAAGAKFKIQGLTGADKNSGDRLLRLDFVQKGAVDLTFDKDSKEIHNWFDEAHLRIVNAFKDMTSEYMHKEIWRIK